MERNKKYTYIFFSVKNMENSELSGIYIKSNKTVILGLHHRKM